MRLLKRAVYNAAQQAAGKVGASAQAVPMFQTYSLALRTVLPVSWAKGRAGLRGIIIGSAHKDFCAGADIDKIWRMRDPAKVFAATSELSKLYRAIETCGGSEYGVEVRALCCEAIRRGSPSSADDAYQRASLHVKKVAGFIRDQDLKRLFLSRPIVERILIEAGTPPLELLTQPPESIGYSEAPMPQSVAPPSEIP